MKIRVYEIAREMGKSHDSMVAICKHLKCEIKGAMSSLSSEDEQKVRNFVKTDEIVDHEIFTREYPREPQKELHPQLMRDLGITR